MCASEASTAVASGATVSPRPPLEGILVADFTRVLAGPYATMMLGDLGADVVKVEGRHGDDTRHWVPPARGPESTYFLGVNRNKRSLVLDLTDADDRALGHELARRADVFVHNFKPGGLEKYGLGYDQVAALNPRSVYCSISGFGGAGGAHLPGYDLLVQGASGLMSLTGDADGPPRRAGVALFDVMTGLTSVIGILAALRHRDTTGEGQHVETDLLSTAMSTLVNQTSAFVAGEVVPRRMGNAHPSLFPYEPLPTGTGELIVVAGNDAQFRRLVDELGAPELADDPRFATVGQRNEHRGELRPLLVEALSTRSAQEWFDRLSAAGVVCGPINDVAGGVELAQRLGLEPVVEIDGVPTVRNPIRLSGSSVRYDRPPPALDSHGQELRRWLAAAESGAGS